MRKVILAAVVLFSAASASAQHYFGVKAGPNMSFLSHKIEDGDESENWNGSRVGFQVGGVAQIGIAENFAIQPELLFMMKGANNVKPEALGDVELNFQTFTIDMPITFLYRNKGFFGGLGPNLSFGVSSKMKVDGFDEEYDMYEDAEGEAVIFGQKRFEVGANVLAGYKLKNGLAFSLNFVQGLTNSSKYNDELDGEDVSLRIRSSYIGLSVGYFFGK